jgi:hypothetical protein
MSSRDTAAVGLTSLPEFHEPRPLNAPRQAAQLHVMWVISVDISAGHHLGPLAPAGVRNKNAH